jgi:ADP-heptose:LPS heptosyltransferase
MSGLVLDRVVVVRALKGLGDFLCVVPALRALRAALPQSQIALLGLSSSHALVSRFSNYIDELIPFPGFPGIPEEPLDVARLPAFIVAAQERRFDLAIQMHGNGALMNPFTVMLGAKASAGYYAPGAYCPDPDRYLVLNESDHEVRRWVRLLAHLGVPECGEQLEFPLQPADRDALRKVPEASALAGRPYVVLHPGASEPARRWSPEHFAVVADYLARDGYQVVLTGTPDETQIAAEVAARMRYSPVNLAGRTGLGAMAALLSRATLVVSNDTGASHLATALRVPSVVVFIASDPQRWAPLDRELHRIVGRDGLLPEQVHPDAVLREAYALIERGMRSGSKARRSGDARTTGIAPRKEAPRVLTARS